MRIKFIMPLLFVLSLISCSDSEYKEIESEKFQLNYSNGKKYCDGIYRVYSNGKENYKSKDGIWKFYDLNGQPEKIKEYDLDDLINYKEFNEFGKIIVSEIITDKTHTVSRFYDNGNLKYENITTFEMEEDYVENDQGQTAYYEEEYSYSTIKEYHKNGQLKSLRKKEDDFSTGIVQIWDDKGNLILEHETLE